MTKLLINKYGMEYHELVEKVSQEAEYVGHCKLGKNWYKCFLEPDGVRYKPVCVLANVKRK